MRNDNPIIVALDCPSSEVLDLVDRLDIRILWYKVGPVLLLENPSIIQHLKKKKKRIMLDLKFHDIPNTVERACYNAARLGVDMLTVHLSGGLAMLKAAREGIFKASLMSDIRSAATKVLGISVLTSINSYVLNEELNIDDTVEGRISSLLEIGGRSGISGIVCSAHETSKLREEYPKMIIVNPGIRLPGDSQGDQKRIATPKKAMSAGADYIVMGRSIYEAPNPAEIVENIMNNISGGNPPMANFDDNDEF